MQERGAKEYSHAPLTFTKSVRMESMGMMESYGDMPMDSYGSSSGNYANAGGGGGGGSGQAAASQQQQQLVAPPLDSQLGYY